MTASSFTTLISIDELQQRIASGTSPVVIDTGFDLADPGAGRRGYAEAHIPDAQYLHLDDDLSGTKTGHNGRHPLPDRAEFRALVGALGIVPDTQVVALDSHGGVYASRLWWLLRWLGHDKVAVLDGGLPAWVHAGGAVVSGESTTGGAGHSTANTTRAPYPDRHSLERVLSADDVAAGLGRMRLIDARAAERFRGDVEPIDAKAGHIPGATHRFWKDNLQTDGRWKDARTLNSEFTALLGASARAATVHQCGSGVTACHNLLAMAHAGLDGSGLYAGSWSEWSADPLRPVARG